MIVKGTVSVESLTETPVDPLLKNVIIFVLLFSSLAAAQTSNVTATITDPDAQTWNNGTYTINFVPTPGVPGPYTWNGGQSFTKQFFGTMSASGVITQSLPSNNFISPAGSMWRFTLCSNSSAPCQDVVIAVTGASPNLSSALSTPLAAPRFQAGPFAFGYLDIEVNSPNTPLIPGVTYWNVSNSVTRQWNGTAWQNLSGGGGGSSPGAPNFSTQINSGGLFVGVGPGGKSTELVGTATSPVYQAKAIYDTRDWMTCDGATDATAGMSSLVSAIGSQNATIRVIGSTTPTASCVIKFAHTGTNITLDFSGGGSFSLLNVVTPPGGGAFVQGAGQANNPSSSTCSRTLTSTVAGNFIVMMVSLYNTFGNSRIASVTDSTGNFYLQQQASTLGQAGYEALYVAPSIAGGTTTVTANFSGTATKNACIAWEASGLGPVPKIDNGTFNYGSTTPFNSGAATLAAGDFVVGFSEDPNDPQTCTAAGGFTQPAGTAGNVSSAGPSMCAEYIANGAGGSTTATQNFSNSPVASSYVSSIVGLKPGIATLSVLGGVIDPDNHQIFFNATGANGIVDFTGNLASFSVLPEWWGASAQPGANVTTNTAAIQASEIAAFGCGLTTCRKNGSGLNIYNKTWYLAGNYQINAEITFYHVSGGAGSRAAVYCAAGGGLTQTATNLRILDGQSDAYLRFDNCSWTGNASSTGALTDFGYSAAQGVDFAPQFIDFYGNTWVGNNQVAIGLIGAKEGGGAQFSNIYCYDCAASGFTTAAWQIGTPSLLAQNALAIAWYGGDMQGNPQYGLANYGGGYILMYGVSFENGFTTQTGFDVFCSLSQGPCDIEHTRSESRKIAFCSPCQLKDVFAINQSSRITPGSTDPVGTIKSGNHVTGDGAYYKVTVDSSAYNGVGTVAAPIRASSGTASSITNTNQSLTGSVTVKTFPGASLNETMTQSVSGATGVRLNSPANNATITGTASGSQIVFNETMTQAVTGVTCTEQSPSPATGTSQNLICNNFSGTADNSHAWTGGTSGGVYTPSAAPSFAAASPILLLGSVTGAPDSTHIWTGGTSGGVYTPTQAPQPANYTVNGFTGMLVGILSGTSQFCYGTIASNTSTAITISGGWITKYPQIQCPAPDGTSSFVVEPAWNHGTVVDGGITMVYMNENVIDGDNGAIGTFEDVIAYGGQWHMGASPSNKTTILRGQVSRQDWYTPANSTPRGQIIASTGQGTLIDGNWDVRVFPPGADRPQNWNNLSVGSATTTYQSAIHQNLNIAAQCWNTSTDTQSANEVCIGGRSDPGAGTTASRNILEIFGMLGRGAPVPNAANSYNITDQNGTDTDITGGPSTGAGNGGAINFWTSNPSGSSATPNSGLKRWLVSTAGHWFAGLDNTYDIGAAGANRPRTMYAATSVVTGSSNGGLSATEGTGAGVPAGAGLDTLWPDSTDHRWKVTSNNSGPENLVLSFASGTVTTAGTAVGNGTCQSQTGITVTGALTSDNVIANIGASLPATWQTGIVLTAHVTSANTVTVYLCNPTAGSITPAATVVNVRIVR